jgi:hypothetical protein
LDAARPAGDTVFRVKIRAPPWKSETAATRQAPEPLLGSVAVSCYQQPNHLGPEQAVRRVGKTLVLFALWAAVAGCNPTYLPITPTGVLQPDEFELGGYVSVGYVGRKVRPLGYRGLVTSLGFYFRKGIYEDIDWTMTLDNFTISTAIGFQQEDELQSVLRPRIGIGWMNGFWGVDYAVRLSEGKTTLYSFGGSMFGWIGDAYWTDDPGRSWGVRFGPMVHVGAEPQWERTVSGGVRLDWAPFQFGGRGAPETITDFIGGKRNPYAEPVERGLLAGWQKPIVAFEPAAFVFTGGPAMNYHRDGGVWVPGGEKDEEE